MALEKNNNAVFLSISDGKITKRVKQPTSESVTRVTKEGKTVHEEIYDGVSGIITDIQVKEHQSFGKFWNITIEDDGVRYILRTNYSGGYASAFLKTLPNVDLEERVRFAPHMKIENDKKKVTLFLQQGGKALKHAYTKDEPNGLPQMKQIKVKGVLQWDDSEMMEFLENMVKTTILPKIKAQPAQAEEDEETDDLPF